MGKALPASQAMAVAARQTAEQRLRLVIGLCRHCGHMSNLTPVAQFDMDEGNIAATSVLFQLVQCPGCAKVSLFGRRVQQRGLGGVEVGDAICLFPPARTAPVGLPDAIAAAFEAAEKQRGYDANAYGAMVGRMLERVCTERGAPDDLLVKRIQWLAKNDHLPAALAGIADGIRGFRNYGAHGGEIELTETEVPLLDAMSRAILEYLYTAPALLAVAEDRLREMKQSEKGAAGEQTAEST